MCTTKEVEISAVETILIDADYLASTKKRIQENDPSIKFALEQLIHEAEIVLNQGPYSVTHKEKLPPSGDKHDYASYSRYWWPDPNKEDGLPYIRKDGETNPESQNLKASDRPRIGAMGSNSETLGLAYYLSGEKKYAIKAAQLLRVWFLNESTRMNPNLKHAQCRPGHNLGSKSGILDGRLMVKALESSLLIADSDVLTEREMQGLKDWASDYFNWLTTNEMALAEAASKNNHGSYYDAQTMYFGLYAEHEKDVKSIAENFLEKRLDNQIAADGSMPEEMQRTRPLFYSMYNLHAILIVAHLAKKVEVGLWRNDDEISALKLALDYLTPYADSTKVWPTETLGDADRMDLFPILQMAHNLRPEGNYLQMLEKLPLEESKIHRANLALPLMR